MPRKTDRATAPIDFSGAAASWSRDSFEPDEDAPRKQKRGRPFPVFLYPEWGPQTPCPACGVMTRTIDHLGTLRVLDSRRVNSATAKGLAHVYEHRNVCTGAKAPK